MKIRMKETKLGSPDGALVTEYKKGRTYDVPDKLADAFVKAGWATAKGLKRVEPKVEEPKAEEPDETKVIVPEETKDEEETEEEEELKDEKPPEPEKKDKK